MIISGNRDRKDGFRELAKDVWRGAYAIALHTPTQLMVSMRSAHPTILPMYDSFRD
jgi:hypothetical protein